MQQHHQPQQQQQQYGQSGKAGQSQFGQVDFSRPIKTREETVKLYTEWANHYLEKAGYSRFISDLQNDVRDGRLLVDIIHAVANEKVPINAQTKTPVELVDCCIKLLSDIGVDISDVTTDGIVSGKLKCVLALFFSLSKHKQKMRSQTKLPIPGAIRPSILPTSVGPPNFPLRCKDVEQKSNSESPDADRRYVTPPSSVQNSLPDIQMSKERVNSNSPAEPKPRVSSLPVFGARGAGQDSSYAKRTKIPFVGPTAAGLSGSSAAGGGGGGSGSKLRLQAGSTASALRPVPSATDSPTAEATGKINPNSTPARTCPRLLYPTANNGKSIRSPRPVLGTGGLAVSGAQSGSVARPSVTCCIGTGGAKSPQGGWNASLQEGPFGTNEFSQNVRQADASGTHCYENSQQLPRKPKGRPRTRPDLVRVSSCSTNPSNCSMSPTLTAAGPIDSPIRRPPQEGLQLPGNTTTTTVAATTPKAPFGYRFVNAQPSGCATSATGVPPLRNLPYKTRVSAPMVVTTTTNLPMSAESPMSYNYPVVESIQSPQIYQKHQNTYSLPPRFYVPPNHQYAPLAAPASTVFLGSANSDSIPSLVRSPRLTAGTACHQGALGSTGDTSVAAAPRQTTALSATEATQQSSRTAQRHRLPPAGSASQRVNRPMENSSLYAPHRERVTLPQTRASGERNSLESRDDSSLGTDSPPGSPGEINRAVSELEGANPSTWSGREGFDRLSRLEISTASTTTTTTTTVATTGTSTTASASGVPADSALTHATPFPAVTSEHSRPDANLRSASLASVNRLGATADAAAPATDSEDRSVRSECLYDSPVHLRRDHESAPQETDTRSRHSTYSFASPGSRPALTNYFSDTDLVGEGADWMDGCQSLPMMRQSAGATVETGRNNYLLRRLPIPPLRTPGSHFPLVANHQAPPGGLFRQTSAVCSESGCGEDSENVYGVIPAPSSYLCRRASAGSSVGAPGRGVANLMAPIKLPYDPPHSVGSSKRTVKTPTTISPCSTGGFYQAQAANLRQQLEAEQRKVAELTSQLNTNAYVVSAFEQSLANMAQRLQSLTVSAAQKDSELQELRQLIDSMRQDRANDSAMTTMTSSINAEASPTTCTNFQQHEGSTVGRHRNASPAHSVSIFPTGEVHSKCSDVEESSCSTLPPGALTPGQSAKKANWLRSSLCKAFKKKGSQTSLLLPEPNKSESFRWDGFNSLSRSSQAGGEKLCSPPMDSRFKGSENTPLNGACRMIPVSPSNSSTSSSSWSMQVASGRRSSQPSNVVTKTSSIPEEITRKAILEFKSPDHRYEKNSEKPPRTGATATADRATPGLSALTAEKEIDQLRKELADRETKLTEVQLQALASAHQVDQLRDQMTYMFEELTMLRTENEQLQRLSMQIHSVSGSNKSLPHAEQQLLHLAPATCARNCCANISCGSSSSGGGSSAVPSTTPQLSLNSSSYSHASPDQ